MSDGNGSEEATVAPPTPREAIKLTGQKLKDEPNKALAQLARANARSKQAGADQEDDYVHISASYYTLRWGLAILALCFPCLVIFNAGGCDHLRDSLSAYYHYAVADPDHYGAGTARNVFVGVLCAIGAFLVLYRGYSSPEDTL